MDFYWDRPVLLIDSIRKKSNSTYNRTGTYNRNLRVHITHSSTFQLTDNFSDRAQSSKAMLKWSGTGSLPLIAGNEELLVPRRNSEVSLFFFTYLLTTTFNLCKGHLVYTFYIIPKSKIYVQLLCTYLLLKIKYQFNFWAILSKALK